MPFFESAEEATKHAIQASGRSPKAVATILWPALKQDSAYARLMNALNPDKPEKLTADEHVLIANFCNRFDWLYYSAHACHHSRPAQVTPEAQRAELQEKLFARAEELKTILTQIERLRPIPIV